MWEPDFINVSAKLFWRRKNYIKRENKNKYILLINTVTRKKIQVFFVLIYSFISLDLESII